MTNSNNFIPVINNSNPETHTFAILVVNEPGVLARVVGMFSGRGYNIDSLSVREVDQEKKISRINIVSTATPTVLYQIRHQLERLVPVDKVIDLTINGDVIERELALIKINNSCHQERSEVLNLATAFRAKVVDTTQRSFIFELTGRKAKIERFISLMKPMGLIEVARTGINAMARGDQGL